MTKTTLLYRIKDSLRRLNLERRDLAELLDGGIVACNVTDLRYIRDTLKAMEDHLVPF